MKIIFLSNNIRLIEWMNGSDKSEDDSLTLIEIKKIEGFENSTDEEAKQVIEFLKAYAEILYTLYSL